MFIYLNAALADSNQGKLNSCHLKGWKEIGLTDLQGETSLTGSQTHKCQGKHLEKNKLRKIQTITKGAGRQEREQLHAPGKNPGVEGTGNLHSKASL